MVKPNDLAAGAHQSVFAPARGGVQLITYIDRFGGDAKGLKKSWAPLSGMFLMATIFCRFIPRSMGRMPVLTLLITPRWILVWGPGRISKTLL